VYNTWQILHMRRFFSAAAGLSNHNSGFASSPSAFNGKPLMLVLKRSSNSKHTRNGHDLVRQWSDSFADSVVQILQAQFPQYSVELLSDKNHTMMTCHLCMVRLLSRVEVLVGVHGAGLANMIYMKPNSAVVELCPYGNDGRCLLGGGPFSRAAAVLSHNYMIHHPPYNEFVWITDSRTSEFNVTRFAIHIHSFLKSIRKIL
jgi:hypothetical protein